MIIGNIMNGFNEKEIIDNIDKAIALLKNYKVLFTNHLNNKTYFVNKKQRVIVVGVNCKYSLSFDEFKEIYEQAKFVVYEENEESFDFSRDDEYYGWKHK